MTRKVDLGCGGAACCTRESMNFFKLQFANLPHRKSKKAGTILSEIIGTFGRFR